MKTGTLSLQTIKLDFLCYVRMIRTLITYRKSEHHTGVDPGFIGTAELRRKLTFFPIFQVFLMF